jgi:hypothetical protein
MMFNQMVKAMGEAPPPVTGMKITLEQYDRWKKTYLFECLQGTKYGESFCMHFGIVDYILVFSIGVEESDTYIKRTYIQ